MGVEIEMRIRDGALDQREPPEPKDRSHNLSVGKRGELAARCFLEARGLTILECNWKCRFGEADIIAMEDGTLVFVEVKTRCGEGAGLPEEAVTRERRRRYERIAIEYLREQRELCAIAVRFDVVAITVLDEGRAFVRYHRDAFGVGD